MVIEDIGKALFASGLLSSIEQIGKSDRGYQRGWGEGGACRYFVGAAEGG